jgi:hypothetical protein
VGQQPPDRLHRSSGDRSSGETAAAGDAAVSDQPRAQRNPAILRLKVPTRLKNSAGK